MPLLLWWLILSAMAPNPSETSLDLIPGQGYTITLPHSEPHDLVTIPVNLFGTEGLLDLHRISLRAPDFRVIAVGHESEILESEQLSRPATYRGRLIGLDGEVIENRVSGSRHPEGTWSILIHRETQTIGIQPDPKAAPGSRSHWVYRSTDIAPDPRGCGTQGSWFERANPLPLPPGLSLGQGTFQTEIAFDADFPYFEENGFDIDATLRDIELIMNGVDMIFRRDVQISYEITTVIIRTSALHDPYVDNRAGFLLNELEAQWMTNHTKVIRDVVHLMTGRPTGGTIGVANFNAICNFSRGYALSQTQYSTNLVNRVQLTAHELGHNWNAVHCRSTPECQIMCPSIGGCEGQERFGPLSQETIIRTRDGLSCLDFILDSAQEPFYDSFESDQINPLNWAYSRGVDLAEDLGLEPSGRTSLKLSSRDEAQVSGDDFRSQVLDLSHHQQPALTFFAQRRGIESGSRLFVEGLAPTLEWRPITTWVSDGNDTQEFLFSRTLLPSWSLWEGFRLRFTAPDQSVRRSSPRTKDFNRAWYLDDIQVRDGGTALSVSPLSRGSSASLSTFGSNPADYHFYFVNFEGRGDGPCFGGTCLELDLPVFLLGLETADQNGRSVLGATIPANFPPVPVYFQVFVTDASRFVTTHLVETQIR